MLSPRASTMIERWKGPAAPTLAEPALRALLDEVIEWDAVVDEIVSIDAIWYQVKTQPPDGIARALAEKLGVPPVPEASSADLAAWSDARIRIRTSRLHRLLEPRTILLEAFG